MSLPSGYKRLEYIQSSGTQYIDTRYYQQSENFRVKTEFAYVGSSSAKCAFGAQSGNGFLMTLYGQREIIVGTNGAVNTQHTRPLDTRFLFDVTANNGKLSGTQYGQTVSSTYTGTLLKTVPLAIFHNNGGTTSQICPLRLYYFQMYDNGTLVRDYIPCQKPDGTIGLWDDVNSIFYGNAGTGTFTAGPEIIPDPPAAPTGLQTVLAVVLQWAASANADRYDVYRDGAKIGSTETTQYVDATPEANQTYVYTVKAVNGGGESAGTSITVYTKSGYFEYKPLIESANFP